MERQSRGRQRKASLSALGYLLPPAKPKLPAGWLGPSLREEAEQDHLPRAILGRFTEFLLLLEKGCLQRKDATLIAPQNWGFAGGSQGCRAWANID